MSLLWQELEKRNIPISVVVDLHPAQILSRHGRFQAGTHLARVVRGQVQTLYLSVSGIPCREGSMPAERSPAAGIRTSLSSETFITTRPATLWSPIW